MTEQQRPVADFTLSDDLGVIAVLVVREGRFPWFEGRLYEVREDRREALMSREGVTHESTWELADGTRTKARLHRWDGEQALGFVVKSSGRYGTWRAGFEA